MAMTDANQVMTTAAIQVVAPLMLSASKMMSQMSRLTKVLTSATPPASAEPFFTVIDNTSGLTMMSMMVKATTTEMNDQPSMCILSSAHAAIRRPIALAAIFISVEIRKRMFGIVVQF